MMLSTGSKAPRPDTEKGILSALIYYDLRQYPLTALEIFRYLGQTNSRVSFFELTKILAESESLRKKVDSKQGIYFLKDHAHLIKQREEKLKTSQIKWKKLKNTAWPLTFIPFLRLAAVSGSLTFYNAKPTSDFDLLIIAQTNRLWTARILVTAILALCGKRRHGLDTNNMFCLNCYLTQDHLEIKKQAKPRDLHSAQEYGRLNLLIEKKPGLYLAFIKKNSWLKEFLNNYPWLQEHSAKKIKINQAARLISTLAERLLSGNLGDWLEKKLGDWQTQKISQSAKNNVGAADQIYFSQECLMFHPQSKSYSLMEQYRELAEKIIK